MEGGMPFFFLVCRRMVQSRADFVGHECDPHPMGINKNNNKLTEKHAMVMMFCLETNKQSNCSPLL